MAGIAKGCRRANNRFSNAKLIYENAQSVEYVLRKTMDASIFNATDARLTSAGAVWRNLRIMSDGIRFVHNYHTQSALTLWLRWLQYY